MEKNHIPMEYQEVQHPEHPCMLPMPMNYVAKLLCTYKSLQHFSLHLFVGDIQSQHTSTYTIS